jgi:hypothetical protein
MPFLSYSVANDTYNSMGYFTQFNDISNPNINLWQIFKNGKMISLNKFIELQTELSYTKFITKRLGIGVKCGFDLYSFAEYEQLLYSKYLNTNILIGLTFKL